jgi:hypothetical protein
VECCGQLFGYVRGDLLGVAPDVGVLQFNAEGEGQRLEILVGFEQEYTSLPV